VIAPILNLQNFSRVTVFDPHSDVLEACINNFDKITNHQLVGWALRKISPTTSFKDICLISPDAGAYKKIFDVAQEFGIKQVVTATKVRDMATGKILHTEVSNLPVRIEPDGEPFKYVIIDDICDGGRTFIEIAKAISEQQESAKLYTIVSHGIFSSGYSSLYNYFEHIYTTNSVKNIVNDPEDTDFERKAKGAVSQYNLF
jgi:ribose-phosphate pyrophosphokinase